MFLNLAKIRQYWNWYCYNFQRCDILKLFLNITTIKTILFVHFAAQSCGLSYALQFTTCIITSVHLFSSFRLFYSVAHVLLNNSVIFTIIFTTWWLLYFVLLAINLYSTTSINVLSFRHWCWHSVECCRCKIFYFHIPILCRDEWESICFTNAEKNIIAKFWLVSKTTIRYWFDK